MFDDDDDDDNGPLDDQIQEDVELIENYFNGGKFSFMDSYRLEAVIDFFMVNYEYEKAVKTAELGVENFDYNPTFKLRKAQSLTGLGNYNEALIIINNLESSTISKFDIFVTRASIYSQLRDSKNAIKNFKLAMVLANEEERRELYLDVAMEFQHINDYRSAITFLLEGLKEDQKNHAALFELAYCYDKINENREAIKKYLEFIDEQPYSAMAWYNLGNSYTKIEDYKLALQAFDYSIIINDSNPAVHFNLGNTYMSLEEYTEAIECFEHTLNGDAGDALALAYIAEAYEQLKDYKMSKKFYDASLTADPLLPEAWLGLGILEDIAGNVREGLVFMNKAFDLDKENSAITVVMAIAYYKLLDRVNADFYFKLTLELQPDDEDALIDYVRFLLDDSALKTLNYLTEYQEILEVNISYFTLYTHVLIQLGRLKEALALMINMVDQNYSQIEEIMNWNPKLFNHKDFVNLLHDKR